jgi:hypothetical protein
VERVTAGEIELVWEPERRLATMRYLVPKTGGADEARRLTEQLQAWTAGIDDWALLVDCGRIANVDAGWRTVWFEYFKAHAQAARIAWFNANTLIKVVIQMFLAASRFASPLQGRAFGDEAEARAYLREHGYDV